MTNVKGVVDLKAIPVPLPPIEDQARIILDVDRRLSLIRETEAQVEANLTRAERLRQTILHAAFSGGLNVTGLESGLGSQKRKSSALSATGLSV